MNQHSWECWLDKIAELLGDPIVYIVWPSGNKILVCIRGQPIPDKPLSLIYWATLLRTVFLSEASLGLEVMLNTDKRWVEARAAIIDASLLYA